MTENGKKTAIVTGASKGLGLAVVRKLAAAGLNVFACMSGEHEEFLGEKTRLEKEYGVCIEPIYFDLADSEQIKAAYKSISSHKIPISMLVNNAGIGHMGLLQMTRFDDVQRFYAVNVLAPIFLTQLVVKNMQKNHYGRIVNIVSTAATEVYEGNSIYGSSKAALSAFTKCAGAEFYRYGITVNAVAPGLMDTGMAPIFEGSNPSEPLSRTPLGRKLTVDEVADAVLLFLEDKMNVVNGEILTVSGGHK